MKIKHGGGMLPTGYIIAMEQFPMPYAAVRIMPNPGNAFGLNYAEKGEKYIVSGRRFGISFDMTNGMLENISYGHKDLVLKAPLPYFWREPNDNDHGYGMAKNMLPWKLASGNRQMKSFEVVKADSRQVEILVNYDLPDVYSEYSIRYKIDMV